MLAIDARMFGLDKKQTLNWKLLVAIAVGLALVVGGCFANQSTPQELDLPTAAANIPTRVEPPTPTKPEMPAISPVTSSPAVQPTRDKHDLGDVGAYSSWSKVEVALPGPDSAGRFRG